MEELKQRITTKATKNDMTTDKAISKQQEFRDKPRKIFQKS